MTNLGVLYALGSAFSYATNNLFNKKLSEKLNEYEALIIASFFLLFFAGIGNYLFGSFYINLNLENTLFILSGSLIGFIGLLYLFKSFAHLPVGIILTLANTFPIITLLLTTLYHREAFILTYLGPLLLIFLGIYYLHSSSEKIKSKFIYMPLITAFGWGFYSFTSFTLIENNLSPVTITFYLEGMIFIYAIIFSLFKKRLNFTSQKIKSNLIYALFAGLFLTLGNLALNFALTKLHPAVASSIGTSDIVFGSILSYLIFKEKLSKKELIGIGIILLAILMYFFI